MIDIERVNPYQSPEAHRSPGPPQRVNSSRIPLAVVSVGAVAYHGFVLLLLTSRGDQAVGLLFLLNTPVIAIWILGLRRNQRHMGTLGFVTACIQLSIYRIAGGGLEVDDWMMITAVIVITMTILSFVCYVFGPRSVGAFSIRNGSQMTIENSTSRANSFGDDAE